MSSPLFDPRNSPECENEKRGNNPPEADDRRHRQTFRHAIDLALAKLKKDHEPIAEEDD